MRRKIYVEKSHNNSKFYFVVNSFWMIQNNEPVIDTLNKISNPKAIKSVSAFEVSKLYTNISHNRLYTTQNFVIYFTFAYQCLWHS